MSGSFHGQVEIRNIQCIYDEWDISDIPPSPSSDGELDD